jgi:hypothetical protein
LAAREGEAAVPRLDGLILLSPAIRVTPAAALAGWQAALARRIGLETLAWSDVQPEFDPYKYNSFTLNAGEQIHQLTRSLAERLDRLAARDGGQIRLPPVLAFQSVVDATIPVAAVVDGLLLRLAPGPHALILFDVNRYAEARALMIDNPEALITRLLRGPPLGFTVTVVTNSAEDSRTVVARTRPAGRDEVQEAPLGLAWPPGMFSLSHVALPFAPDDRVYGARAAGGTERNGITLGSITLLGERGILQIPDGFFLRLRYNPFFSYLAERAEAFLHDIDTRDGVDRPLRRTEDRPRAKGASRKMSDLDQKGQFIGSAVSAIRAGQLERQSRADLMTCGAEEALEVARPPARTNPAGPWTRDSPSCRDCTRAGTGPACRPCRTARSAAW